MQSNTRFVARQSADPVPARENRFKIAGSCLSWSLVVPSEGAGRAARRAFEVRPCYKRGVRRASVYVHFPWCLAKCPYCDFVSYAKKQAGIDHAGYADAVLREVGARARAFGDRVEIGSIFFGGGTPSLWDPRELGRVLLGIRASFVCTSDVEITVECNPTSLDRDRAASLLDQGVGRLSIGTQSLKDDQLKFLGRLHDAAGALRAIEEARSAGMMRVSADLIFGLPDQTAEDARSQAESLADLGLSHLSCYQLTIEPGTSFGELARQGRLPLADDGRVADAFLAIDEALTSRDLLHYEISNYARPGQEARHNLGYWRGEEYVGLGCAAYGFVRTDDDQGARGLRYRNAVDPERYTSATLTMRDAVGDDGVSTSHEPLDGETMLRERIMLGLRLKDGFNLAACADELGVTAWTKERRRATDKLVARGRLECDGDQLRIPRPAWLWADDTAARLF
jgi:putative oxygen-independent coproporphyrinogen III oxidase